MLLCQKIFYTQHSIKANLQAQNESLLNDHLMDCGTVSAAGR